MFTSFAFAQKAYHIDIEKKPVNITGQTVDAMVVGGTIPGKTITAQEGEVLTVTFNNKMDLPTSIHWHGILLPNDQDGVPFLTTMPIAPHSSFTYQFPVIQSGTYWYHSHTGLQEQRGVYGALIFYPKKKHYDVDEEAVVVLSDWSDEDPKQILSNLKRDGDYYALKKNTVQSWYQVIRNGAVKQRIRQAWTRMGPMDLSDIGYDAFLMNGAKKTNLISAGKGKRVLLRVINASASSYFNLNYSGGKMEVVAADGMPVQSFFENNFLIAIAETYDVIVTLPENKKYELRATAQDGTGFSSGFIGKGGLVPAMPMAKPNLYGDMDHSKMHAHHHGHMQSVSQTPYHKLVAPHSTAISKKAPERVITLKLTGNMERYTWNFNNKTLSEADDILIRKGEKAKFILINETMMHHPLHLHGHFFRVINGKGEKSPLKHTVDIAPMKTVTIEFAANEEKSWLFHCHNLYHMKTGMTRVITYEDSVFDPAMQKARKLSFAKHNPWYQSGNLALQTNQYSAMLRLSNTRNAIEFEGDAAYGGAHDAMLIYLRNINRYLDLYAGSEFERDKSESSDNHGIIGFRYVLPLLIEADLRYGTDHKVILGLSSNLQLTKRLNFSWEVETDDSYDFLLAYEVNKSFSILANYTSDYYGGFGMRYSF